MPGIFVDGVRPARGERERTWRSMQIRRRRYEVEMKKKEKVKKKKDEEKKVK